MRGLIPLEGALITLKFNLQSFHRQDQASIPPSTEFSYEKYDLIK